MNESTVVYTRVASKDRSTAEQRQRGLEYATETIGLDETDVRVLSDRGTGARADGSSGYQRLSSLVAAGEVARVIVTDASRIARNVGDLSEIVARLVGRGVAIHVIDDDLRVGEHGDAVDSADPDDETVLWALEIAADLEESIGAERTREGIDAAKANGKHVGRPPFGFDSRAGRLIPNDDFETALDVIDRIETGKSKRSTARRAGISRTTVQNVVDRTDLYLEYAEASRQ